MAVVTKDLGPVSSYAIAVEHGYQGTEQEWIQLLMDTEANAQAARDAADDAQEVLDTLDPATVEQTKEYLNIT